MGAWHWAASRGCLVSVVCEGDQPGLPACLPPSPLQGHIPFAQSRADTAHIARRKAATAAIAARRYTPPTAQPPRPPARGLLSSGAAPSPQLQPQPAAAGGGQQSLLSFGFTVQQHGTPVAASGPESMDVE